jgi:hypothetical protein
MINSSAERLLCEHDTEEFRSLLAECYLKENKPHKVCHLLKDCKTDYARLIILMDIEDTNSLLRFCVAVRSRRLREHLSV